MYRNQFACGWLRFGARFSTCLSCVEKFGRGAMLVFACRDLELREVLSHNSSHFLFIIWTTSCSDHVAVYARVLVPPPPQVHRTRHHISRLVMGCTILHGDEARDEKGNGKMKE